MCVVRCWVLLLLSSYSFFSFPTCSRKFQFTPRTNVTFIGDTKISRNIISNSFSNVVGHSNYFVNSLRYFRRYWLFQQALGSNTVQNTYCPNQWIVSNDEEHSKNNCTLLHACTWLSIYPESIFCVVVKFSREKESSPFPLHNFVHRKITSLRYYHYIYIRNEHIK